MQHNIVKSGIFEQGQTFVEGVQKFQSMVVRIEHRARMGVEA